MHGFAMYKYEVSIMFSSNRHYELKVIIHYRLMNFQECIGRSV